jgi:hypothetical protein
LPKESHLAELTAEGAFTKRDTAIDNELVKANITTFRLWLPQLPWRGAQLNDRAAP